MKKALNSNFIVGLVSTNSIDLTFQTSGWFFSYPHTFEYDIADGSNFFASNAANDALPDSLEAILVGFYYDGNVVMEPKVMTWIEMCELVIRHDALTSGWVTLARGQGSLAYAIVMPDDTYFVATDPNSVLTPRDLNTVKMIQFDKHGNPLTGPYHLTWSQCKEVVNEYLKIKPGASYESKDDQAGA